jgi:hypothetical protein
LTRVGKAIFVPQVFNQIGRAAKLAQEIMDAFSKSRRVGFVGRSCVHGDAVLPPFQGKARATLSALKTGRFTRVGASEQHRRRLQCQAHSPELVPWYLN